MVDLVQASSCIRNALRLRKVSYQTYRASKDLQVAKPGPVPIAPIQFVRTSLSLPLKVGSQPCPCRNDRRSLDTFTDLLSQ